MVGEEGFAPPRIDHGAEHEKQVNVPRVQAVRRAQTVRGVRVKTV